MDVIVASAIPSELPKNRAVGIFGTESQRAMVAARIANVPRGGVRESQNTQAAQTANWQFEAISETAAAELVNVSERSVTRSKTIIEHGAPEPIIAAECGNGTLW